MENKREYLNNDIKALENKLLGVLESYLKNNPQDRAHDIDHIKRVLDLAVEIGKKENCNLKILIPAVIFHDIYRPTKEDKDHSVESAKIAVDILSKEGFSREEIDAVQTAILTSSTSNVEKTEPSSLEAKILWDADKLDGVGEKGIERVKILLKGKFEKEYSDKTAGKWYLGKIMYVLSIGLFTETANNILKDKIKPSLEFCKNSLGDDFEKTLQELREKYKIGNTKYNLLLDNYV